MSTPQTIVVTGASRGIGLAVAHSLVRWGARVVLAGRRQSSLEKAARSIDPHGEQIMAQACDVSDPDQCRSLISRAKHRFGIITALVNNAGDVLPLASVADVDIDEWRHALDVNLVGPFCLAQAVMADVRQCRGRIINVSSGAARTPIAAASAYCTAKAGLNHLTSVMAAEEPLVTTVAVRPGVVDTEMQAVLRRRGPAVMPDSGADYYLELKRLRRLEPPEVPGRAIAWLAVAAPPEWSGRFLSYDDPEIAEAVAAFTASNG